MQEPSVRPYDLRHLFFILALGLSSVSSPTAGQECARPYLDEALHHLRTGRAREALSQARTAETSCTEAEDLRGRAAALVAVGASEARRRNYDEAFVAYDRALSIAREVGDQWAAWPMLLGRGECHRTLKRYGLALSDFRDALEELALSEASDAPVSMEVLAALGPVAGFPADFLRHAEPYAELAKPLLYRVFEVAFLTRIAAVHFDLKEFEEALLVLEDALDKAVLEVMKPELMKDVGRAQAALRQWPEAIEALERAFAGAQKASEVELQMESLNELAKIDSARYRPGMSVRSHERILQLARRSGNLRWESIALHNLGEAHFELERPDQAISYLKTSVQISGDTEDHREEIQSLVSLSNIYLSLGRLSDARPLLERCRALAPESEDDGILAGILNLEGNLQRLEGRPGDARQSWTRALELARASGDERLELRILDSLAFVYSLAGDHRQSLVCQRQSLEISRRLRDLGAEAANLTHIAITYVHLDLLEEAHTYAQEGLAKAIEAGNREAERVAGLVVGSVLFRIGDIAGARRHLREFLETLAGPHFLAERVAALGLLAEIEVEEDPESSLRLAMEALEISEEQGLVELEAAARLALGSAYLRLSRFEEAEEAFTSALEFFGASGVKITQVQGQMGLAAISVVKGTRKRALEKLDASLSMLDSIRDGTGSAEQLSAISRIASSIYSLAIHLALEEGDSARAFGYAERERAPVFLRRLTARREEGSVSIPEHVVEEGRKLQQGVVDAREALESNRATAAIDRRRAEARLESDLMAARQRFEKFSFEVKERYPDFPLPSDETPPGLKEVQAEIVPDGASLLYFHGPFQHPSSKIRVWVIDRSETHLVTLALTPAELGESVRYLFSMLRGRDFDYAAAGELYRSLTAPLEPYLRHRELVIVPHTYLHFLPLAALWNEETGRFLSEDYTLSHVPSAAALRFLRRNQSDNRGGALVMGHAGRSLSHVDLEARSVARLLGADALTGPAAKESVLHAAGLETDVIHLAAHGSFESRSPTFSYLALAPGDGHDGRLELHEIAGLELAGTNLVVLSACDTFLGELQWSDDLTGMTRAFLEAGSPAVVTSLWPIDDEASAVFMEGFYRHLLTAASSAEALRQAQIDVMGVAKWRLPYYWAAFVLTGDPKWNPPLNKVEARVSTPRN